ncbi:MAG: pyridoxal phosphate-dependent aminotransferase [Cellvibrionales bacterium]|nr:pyridoxal phosphate-dependent aminotransferase [Cellvibrionales bacterium]
MKLINKSQKLDDVCYDIRGPVLQSALALESQGEAILKLNIGNPAPFGFEAPDSILDYVAKHLHDAEGYSHSKGIIQARSAILSQAMNQGFDNINLEDILLGNGVSELIVSTTQALLNNGDEILVPSPDYPLWTAAANLAGGKAVHYLCDEAQDWAPDIEDIKSKITTKTKAIVIINPNNPTGAVYPIEILQQIADLAEKHALVVFADEIYDKILYDDAQHIPMGTLIKNTLCITFNGLSKAYRLAGFRAGWAILSGNKTSAKSYIEGINMLLSMRLCANVPAQLAIEPALTGKQCIDDLRLPQGRLHAQREIGYSLLTQIEGISCVKPKGGIYLFPKLDLKRYPIKNDEQLIHDLLMQEKILLVQGSAFNLSDHQHFRLVFLPEKSQLMHAISKLAHFLHNYTF